MSGSNWLDQKTALEVLEHQSVAIAPDPRWFALARWPQSPPRLFELRPGRPLTVGRQADCSIVCAHLNVSRRHAELTLDGKQPRLTDLGSRNGCKKNHQLLAPGQSAELAEGDVVAIGPVLLTLTHATLEAAPLPSTVVAESPSIKACFELARRVARLNTTVLLLGETGAGKEVLAESIHQLSPRRAGPLVRLNCASFPEHLLEAELFGHEKGAFTGADRKRVGFIESAHTGTLFLDEIGEMPTTTQAKLLVVLESRRVVRLGSSTPVDVDVRIVSATHRSLPAEMAAGRFREDLYYRLSAFTIEVPPLRERPEDVLRLSERFLARSAEAVGEAPPALTPSAIACLTAYCWPGNVRELRNVMEHAFVVADGEIDPSHLPAVLRENAGVAVGSAPAPAGLRADLDALEREAVERALASCAQNQTKAAQRLGISRRALIHKMVKFGLKRG